MRSIGISLVIHELVTLMAEATGIINARLITTVPSDTEQPQPLTASMLLTMKTRPLIASPDTSPLKTFTPVSAGDGDQFWERWQREYLANLQARPKWNSQERSRAVGDAVVVRDIGSHRNDWPMG